ncbi:uracil-DNA glycosylase family protein [Neptunicella sp. SCSIO 80796]|uniref:uracil-DNA glycosylase family protein n=1 Tax=Neptunicella plasticusilytica TaxID=3117012 RepID=UPI003A4D45F1
MDNLLQQIRKCTLCNDILPLGANPVIRASTTSKLLVIGQAPGTKVHQSGIPWNDASGVRLRQWLGLTEEQFYDERNIAIMPMGFCYPGRGKSGDLPPSKICAPQWHQTVIDNMPQIELTLLIGNYAQQYYLQDKLTLTERVRQWQRYLPRYLPLPHPSPRNNIWLKKNPWFETELLKSMRRQINAILT